MILKSYQLKNLDFKKKNLILLYGQNQGAKEEEISKILDKNQEFMLKRLDEKDILNNSEIFYNTINSGSLFEKSKIVIINRGSDKIVKIIEDVLDKNLDELIIIINSEILDKKSKLRIFFEKNKKTICVPFYPDNQDTLSKIASVFLRQNNISISNENINLIVNKCNGDRGNLNNELTKIKFYCKNKKNISTEDLYKLINLIENHSISELINNCLIENKKKTISILNENNYNYEDSIIIIRSFSLKLKKLLKLSLDYEKNKNIDLTISSAKPPIFWMEKEITKQQIFKWKPGRIRELIYKLSEIEFIVKNNLNNSISIIYDFIISLCSTKTNN